MLLSMTGFGESRHTDGPITVSFELRTVNSRYLKVNTRCSDGYASLESQIEGVIRKQVKRGTVQVNMHVRREQSVDDYQLNERVLSTYWKQLESMVGKWHVSQATSLGSLLSLPGVVQEKSISIEAPEDWPLIEQVLGEALDSLTAMREREGQSMTTDLLANVTTIEDELQQIETQAPLVVEAYRLKITERLNKILAEYDVQIEPADIVREVGIFAERSDISEEIVRLRSHTEQFRETIELKESAGRKLEFVTQEMFRETNTIGSKSNNSEISRHVIEIKGAIERIREMIQNVE